MKKALAMMITILMLGSLLAGCGGTAGSSSGAAAGSSEATAGTDAGGDSVGSEASASGDGELVVAIPDAPSYMDPHIQATFGTYRVTTQIFDRLVQLDNSMQFTPKLAESWDVEDETTTVFHLRQGVKFHNGEEMTAEDVKYSLERCMASEGVNTNYLIIDTVEAVDDYTVKVTTKEPFNALLYRLTLDAAAIVSKTAAESGDDFNANPVGAGPFKFVSWDIGGDVVLEAHEDYYGGAPEIKRLVFRPIPEAINRTIGLETGEIDMAYDLDFNDLETVENNDNLTSMSRSGTTTWY